MDSFADKVSRRRFLIGAGSASASAMLLYACGGSGTGGGTVAGGGGGGGTIEFWDMPWGGPAYSSAGKKLVASYAPASKLPNAVYEVIQWENFSQTFAAAIASETGPAVSSGGGFQAFQFAEQSKIAYADKLIEKFKKNGFYDDFLPNQIEAMHTPQGYVAVPNQLDTRVWWYSKPIFDKLKLTPPTNWEELLSVGMALKKAGYVGYGTGAGSASFDGWQSLVTMMINNGGGLFNTSNEVDVVTPRNIEAMEFVNELVKNEIAAPASVSYTEANVLEEWRNGKFAMGILGPALDIELEDTKGEFLMLPEPLTAPHGDKATLVFQANLMMYTNTPSQEGSEAFLEWYLKHMIVFWEKELIAVQPVLKSIAELPNLQKNYNRRTGLQEWVPAAKGIRSLGNVSSGKLAALEASPPVNEFAQRILGGADPTGALETLQSGLSEIYST